MKKLLALFLLIPVLTFSQEDEVLFYFTFELDVDENIDGISYIVYHGTEPGNYYQSQRIDDPETQAVNMGVEGMNYYAIQTVIPNQLPSELGDEVSVMLQKVPDPPEPPKKSPTPLNTRIRLPGDPVNDQAFQELIFRIGRYHIIIYDRKELKTIKRNVNSLPIEFILDGMLDNDI